MCGLSISHSAFTASLTVALIDSRFTVLRLTSDLHLCRVSETIPVSFHSRAFDSGPESTCEVLPGGHAVCVFLSKVEKLTDGAFGAEQYFDGSSRLRLVSGIVANCISARKYSLMAHM